MNKKVSTIFAMAALMGGVFSGSAYAQTTEVDLSASEALDKIEATTAEVLLAQNGQFLGVEVNNATKAKTLVAKSGEQSVDVKDNFLWTVTVIPATSNNDHVKYTFTNKATGEYLSFNIETRLFSPVATDKVDATKDAYVFTFKEDTESKAYAGEAIQQLFTEAEFEIESTTPGEKPQPKALALDIEQKKLVESISADLNINKLEDASVDALTLNKWYNGKGFNLESNPSNADGNLFESDKRIWAFDVPDGDFKYMTSSGEEITIPSGTYFFTEPKFLGVTEVSIMDKPKAERAKYIDWQNSTFIAVSSTETSEATNADRSAGEGFKLVAVKGSDVILDSNVSEFEGNDLPIWNACFEVEDNYDATAPYSIKLKANFYYKANVNDPNTVKLASKDQVYIGVTGYNGTENRVVSMREEKDGVITPQHAFYFSDSAVKDGRELLKETKTAAVYNIKFVSGNNNLKDKYLTVGLGADGFRYEAKGAAIVDKDYPAFQWVITRAKAEEKGSKPWKYTEITFTNRETGEQFTTKLFNETAAGENCYSLSKSDLTITPFTVNTQSANTYVAEQLKDVSYNANIIIKLEPVETVDQYAGFLKVDNKTIRTLAFARDKNDTSNKLFAAIKYDKNGNPVSLNEDDKFVSDIYDAAQWQLVRVNTATTSRTFVYNNTTTESVDDVAQGDKITAYRYALRYVVNGTETDYYLASKTANKGELKKVEEENVADSEEWKGGVINFIIKENIDGSVSLLPADNWKKTDDQTVSDDSYYYFIKNDAKKAVEIYYSDNDDEYKYNFGGEAAYSTLEQKNGHAFDATNAENNETAALEIRTYLDPQPIEISWPAHEGHVTLKSELGNYITMNEDRDGIIVNENDADTYYLYVTDEKAVVPSFYITKGVAAENGERMYLFNPTDSAAYYVTPEGKYSRIYQWNEDNTKVMFKSGIINETRDTLTLTVKGEADKKVAMEADDNDKNIWGGLNRFKWQIIEAGDEAEGYYYIRQPKADNNSDNESIGAGEVYLANWNDKLTWSNKTNALLFEIENAAAPTANESVSATEVKVIATDGAINIKNAAGKNVVISTILGQIVANEVLTSDNATISVPAGIAIVSVDGEEAVKVSVR